MGKNVRPVEYVLLLQQLYWRIRVGRTDDYVEPPKHSTHLTMNPELKAALCIQGRTAPNKLGGWRAKAAQHAAEQVPKDGWVEQMDPPGLLLLQC